MVGYPSFNDGMIIVRSIFNPDISVQTSIQVQSEITKACGMWTVSQVQHNIESMTPKGNWFTEMLATRGGSGGGTDQSPSGGL